MQFELPATRALEFTRSRTVPVLSCGADKQSFTVAQAVKANGQKLPPKVIFKGVRQLNINTPPRMQISVHKKGWMDEEGIKEWIRRNLRYTADRKAPLVWDSFRGHLTEAVKDLLARRNVDVAVIPGGLTPVLQPLNKALTSRLRTRYAPSIRLGW